MKRFTKRFFAAALVLCMLTGLMAGCGNAKPADNQKNPTATAAPTSTNAPTATSAPLATATPKATPTNTPTPAPTLSPGQELALKYTGFVENPVDMGGRKIKFVTTIQNRYLLTNEDRDQTPNDTLEIVDAIEQLEKDYNCTIEIEQQKAKNMVNALVTAKAAGDVYCDILEFGCSDTYLEQIYSANLVMPLEDKEIADIIGLDTNPWLPASKFGQMFGHQYGVHFKTNNSPDLLRGVIIFNKTLVEKYGLGNPYDMIANKTWTFDKLMEMSASIMTQSDGKVYPLLYSQEGLFIPMLIYANGATIAEYNNGSYKFTGLTDNALEALNFAVDMKTKGYLHPSCEDRKNTDAIYATGEAVFYVGNYAALKKYTQGSIESEYTFGLLPGPLGPHTDGQYNAVSYTEAMFHVMNNVDKPRDVASLLVAFANRTGKHDMIDTELMNTLQDMESAEMLQLMYDNMQCDYSRSISTTRSICSGANKEIMNLEATAKQKYEEIETKVQAAFDELKLTEEIAK